ncbi:MAG: beta-lactamase family protein [Fimbriimonadia bacterium]|jgi:CubicO group peptidase (beta-lactamase class C family)
MTSALLLALTLLQTAPESAAMETAWDYSKSHGGQTMVVLYNGKRVFERYASGGSARQPQMLASGSKSFVGIAAIAAVEDGLIRLDDRACESLTEWKRDAQKSKITYRHLLTMTSGLDPGLPLGRDRIYTWKQIIERPSKSAPGKSFEYGSTHLIVFAEALQRKLKGETFEAYLERRVFRPLGVKVEWQLRNADGNPQVAGGAAMTARDWATFGEWVRLKGKHGGKQIIRASLFDELAKGTPQNPAYGLTWWLVKPVTDQHKRDIPLIRTELSSLLEQSWVPKDALIAAGLGKQRLYVIRSRNLVVVRQGPLFGGNRFDDAEFMSRLLRSKPASAR